MATKPTSPKTMGPQDRAPEVVDRAARSGGPRSLASLVPKLTRAALGKRGFAEAGLMADWPAIAGAEVAAHALPERLDFPKGARMDGTLHLRVEGGWALALQHWEPQLLERINSSLGYKAIARLKLHQGPLPVPTKDVPRDRPRPLDPVRRAALERQIAAEVAGIEDSGLRAAVARLGLSLLARAEEGREAEEKGGKPGA